MTCDKSNGTTSLETIIEENTTLRQAIYNTITGKVSTEQLKRIIGFDETLDNQYIGAQWWFAPKATRQTANKERDDSRANFVTSLTAESIQRVFAAKQYKFDDRKRDYAINIVGIRNGDATTNVFNDWLWLSYWYRGHLVEKVYNITTDPGSYWLTQKVGDVAGTAILVPNQYLDKYQIRKHRGLYDAVCQKWDTTVRVYRDHDKDGELDFSAPIGTAGGINIHRADRVQKLYKIDSHSAGCQVFQSSNDFNEFMSICYKHRDNFSNSFTYTLLTQSDF